MRGQESRNSETAESTAEHVRIKADPEKVRRERRQRLVLGIGLPAAAVMVIAAGAAGFGSGTQQTEAPESAQKVTLTTAELVCTLDSETYDFTVTYNAEDEIIQEGGDRWIVRHVDTEGCRDADELISQIEGYFEENGGSCTVTRETQEDMEEDSF